MESRVSTAEEARKVSKQLLAQGVASRAAELAQPATKAEAVVELQKKAVQAAMQALKQPDGAASSASGKAVEQWLLPATSSSKHAWMHPAVMTDVQVLLLTTYKHTRAARVHTLY